MSDRFPAIPIQMARRVSHRFVQCAAAAATGFVIVSLIGCGIVRQSFGKIAAKAVVLAEIGIEPFVDPAHFLGRSFIQNLMAGSFFGITIGLAAGIGIFIVCLLVESLPYKKLRVACMAILCLLLAYLSHRVFLIVPGGWKLFVWFFPLLTAAACEVTSPTPIWRAFFPSPESNTEDTPQTGSKSPLLIILLNAAAVAAIVVWAVQSLPILRHDAAKKNFFACFRDDILIGTATGRAVDRFYYKHSPYATEFVPPTHFQPVIVASCGLTDEATDLIPRYYTASQLPVRTVLPVYTVSIPSLETAADLFASGAFDIMLLQLSSLGMNFNEAEEFLEARSDLPDNWRVRCAVIESKRSIPNAVLRAIRSMNATDGSQSIRNLISLSFMRPLLLIFKQPLFPAGFLAAALWVCVLIHACSAQGRVWRVASVLILAVIAAALWWIVITGKPGRIALTNILTRLDDRMPSDRETGELLSSTSAETRYVTLRYLSERSDTTRVRRALELFQDPDLRVRMRAVHLVGKALKRNRSHPLRDEVISGILGALSDENFHVRYIAAEAAAAGGLHEIEPDLINLIDENEHLYVTWYAVNAVHKLRSESER